MTEVDTIIKHIESRAEEIRGDFGVARLGVFGSQLHGLKRLPENLLGIYVDLVSAARFGPLLSNTSGPRCGMSRDVPKYPDVQ